MCNVRFKSSKVSKVLVVQCNVGFTTLEVVINSEVVALNLYFQLRILNLKLAFALNTMHLPKISEQNGHLCLKEFETRYLPLEGEAQ